jgi:cell division protein FtsQ
VVAGVAGAGVAYGCAYFLMASPEMALLHPEQVEISGNRNVSRAGILDILRSDRGHSLVRVPLSQRRRQLESIPWVEEATVRRALPHTLQVEIVERTPVAFFRDGDDLALVDLHGVILDRPVQGRFHFPVVTGMTSGMPIEDREKRMQLFSGFMHELETARAGAVEEVSEVDLADLHDLRATLDGLQTGSTPSASAASGSSEAWGDTNDPILVHFGEADFESKYQTLIDKLRQWRATAGRIQSVDLRFDGQAVVNSDTPVIARMQPGPATQKHVLKHAR